MKDPPQHTILTKNYSWGRLDYMCNSKNDKRVSVIFGNQFENNLRV